MKPKTKVAIKLVAVAFIIIVGGYYITKLRSGGERATAFLSLKYKWGVGDTLQNSYDSRSGDYQFLDTKDDIIKKNFRLRTNNVIYLHSKMNEEDLLNLPDTIANVNANLKDKEVLRYEFSFVYDDKTKHIIYLTNYDANPEIARKASVLQKLVQQIVGEAEERFSK